MHGGALKGRECHDGTSHVQRRIHHVRQVRNEIEGHCRGEISVDAGASSLRVRLLVRGDDVVDIDICGLYLIHG